MKQLLEPIFLSRTVYIWDLLLWQGVIILMNLKETKRSKYFGLSLQRCHYKFVIVILIIQRQHDILRSLLNIDSYSSKAKLVALGEGDN